MSMYRLHLKWKNKDISLMAKKLDMTHPYFVSIKDLIFSKESNYLINPNDKMIYNEFKNAKNLMFPFQIVTMIEELDDDFSIEPIIIENKNIIGE